MKIEVDGASWSVEAQRIVSDIHMFAQPGELVGLIGPNGSGKTSLLRMIYRVCKPDAGIVRLGERDIWQMTAKEVARSAAVVAQERTSDFDFSVDEIVMMGRTPHKGLLDRDKPEDDQIVSDALEQVGMLLLARRNFHTLSGGEKQRVLIARVLAQHAKVLILDEPTNHLDIRYQLEILELVQSLNITTVLAMHDLNLAAAYCKRLYLLRAGQIFAQGTPQDVLTPSIIEAAYGVHAEVGTHPSNGKLNIVFVGVKSWVTRSRSEGHDAV